MLKRLRRTKPLPPVEIPRTAREKYFVHRAKLADMQMILFISAVLIAIPAMVLIKGTGVLTVDFGAGSNSGQLGSGWWVLGMGIVIFAFAAYMTIRSFRKYKTLRKAAEKESAMEAHGTNKSETEV